MALEKLAIVHLGFTSIEDMTWEELFSGFDYLKAITYSSSISFISELVDKFVEAEIIFGNESIISYKLEEIISFQKISLNLIKEDFCEIHQNLLDRFVDGTLSLFLANKQLSHEKIYLLESKSGKKRVIFGSANLSWKAFRGEQRENICLLDDEAGYEYYLSVYESLRENATDSVSRDQLLTVDYSDDIDQLPFLKSIEKKQLLIVEPSKNMAESVKFVTNMRMASERLKHFMPESLRSGIVKINASQIRRLKSKLVDDKKAQQERDSINPQFIVDVHDKTVSFMGEEIDLYPEPEEVKKDVDLFIKYFDGFSRFHGDWERLQRQYFEFANWFFVSPFMPILRWTARKYDNEITPYPVYGILYGQSKAGKTCFLETLVKMMVGQKLKISASDFTRSRIESLKSSAKGVPIIVDDMLNDRYSRYAVEAIKNDDFGIDQDLLYYPAVAISANEDVKAIDKQVVRRAIICHAEAALMNMEIMRSKHVSQIQKAIGTSLYRDYLAKMLIRIPELLDEIKNDQENTLPDVLNTSSQVLYEIFNSYTENDLPQYIRELSLRDYFDEKVTSASTIELIRKALKINPKSFKRNRALNELTYFVGESYEVNRMIKQLPENLLAKKVGPSIVMKLDAAENFFGLRFNKFFMNR